MSSWSLRVSVVAVMLVTFVGCDSNPGGPGAAAGPPQTPGSLSKPGEKTVLPKNKNKTVEGPTPLPPD